MGPRRVLLLAGVVAAAGLTAGVTWSLQPGPRPAEGGTGHAVAAVTAPAPPPPTTTEPQPQPQPSYIATLSSPTPYSATPGGPPEGNLAATNPFGTSQVLALVDPPGESGWLHVELPVRPNGSTGWIQASGAKLAETFYKVTVSLAAHTLTVSDAGKVVLSTPAAVGAPASPTPADQTYLWELVRPDNPAGAYGPYIFGLAEYSDTYATFNGGDAQIGIHGQDEAWSVGRAVSHGCVRLPNDVISELASMLPLGTPVSIG